MKLVRITHRHKLHVLPKHSIATLCGLPVEYGKWTVWSWPGDEVTCRFCVESLEDLRAAPIVTAVKEPSAV